MPQVRPMLDFELAKGAKHVVNMLPPNRVSRESGRGA
jgi:hypothetical protein